MPDHVDEESFVVLVAAIEVANSIDTELMGRAADAIAEALTYRTAEELAEARSLDEALIRRERMEGQPIRSETEV